MPIRPPPLKLKYDNFHPMPIQSARRPPVKESFFAKLYKGNWRNFVIAIAGLNALRYAYASYTSYEDAMVDQFEHAPKLAVVSIALCVMYAVSVLIELYGVIGVSIQRFTLVRAYMFLAFLSAVLATTASVLKAASFFLNAEDLMYECVALAFTGQVAAKSQFRSQIWPGTLSSIGLRQAQKECVAAWTSSSWTQVVYVFVFGFMPSMLHYLMVYTYYRQTTDVSHPAYLLSRVSNANANSRGSDSRNGGYARVPVADSGSPRGETNSRNNQRPNPRSARLRVNASNRAAAGNGMTADAAPTASRATSRGLNRPHRPPALVQPEPPIFTPQRGGLLQSAALAAVSSWLSPGPPSFGVNMANMNQNLVGHGRGVVLSLSCSGGMPSAAKYDKFV